MILIELTKLKVGKQKKKSYYRLDAFQGYGVYLKPKYRPRGIKLAKQILVDTRNQNHKEYIQPLSHYIYVS